MSKNSGTGAGRRPETSKPSRTDAPVYVTPAPSVSLHSSISVGAFVLILIGLVSIMWAGFSLREDLLALRRDIEGLRREVDSLGSELSIFASQQRDDWRTFHQALYSTNSRIAVLEEVTTAVAKEIGVRPPGAYERRPNPWGEN